ncbi:MAG: succinate dehydrogenase iron-sulfur subunit [Spirochaetales bacterium]|jgi:succinate dehydrogenase / fumarate reductase, iron-sulfur subunit|nr:succinate dehydrogenase iron-sulfur subunit [Spirochaetales bacterium]
MKVVLEVKRFNPESDNDPHFQRYDIDVEPTDRVLDALMNIKRGVDRTLGFRKSCAHGVCGSDAMRINGKERLACKTLIQDVADTDGEVITLEPLRNLDIERDLMVGQAPFFEKFESVKPFLIPKPLEGEKEYFQSQEDREEIDDATKCILCQSCISACPVMDENPEFIGPAAIIQAARFVFDTRDSGFEDRLDVLDHKNGVWSCDNHFECTKVCPRGIKITKLINLTKGKIKTYREERGEETAESK